MDTEECAAYTALREIEAQGGPQAVSDYVTRLEQNGRHSPGLLMAVAEALRRLGELDGSIACLERVGAHEKEYRLARQKLAHLFNLTQQYSRTLALTDPIAASETTDPVAASRAQALIALNRRGEALEFIGRIERRKILPPALLKAAAEAAAGSGDWPRALEFLDRVPADRRDSIWLWRRALALFHGDALDDALVALEALSADEDYFVRAGLLATRIHRLHDTPEPLIATCDAILAQEPANEAAHETLIREYIDRGRLAEASIAFEQARGARPEAFPKEALQFLILERAGRLRKALRPFRDGALTEGMGEGMRERIATAFYLSGQYGAARQLAASIGDAERRETLRGRIDLATTGRLKRRKLPEDRDGRMVQALDAYARGAFDQCRRLLDTLALEPYARMQVNNFRALAQVEKRLPIRPYDGSGEPPEDSGPLPVIQQLWVDGQLSRVEWLSLRSFVANGHQVHLYSYNTAIEVPVGCEVRDARAILPEAEIFVHSTRTGRSRGSLAGFADLFRWKLIHERGGAWADCDVIALAPIRASRLIATELVQVRSLIAPGVTNCLFAAPPGEAAFQRAFERAASLESQSLRWGEVGVHLMAELVAQEGWGDRLAPPSDICPIPPFRIIDAIAGAFDIEAVLQESRCRAVHLYNEMMRTTGLDKEGPFPRKGLIGVLEKRVEALELARAPTPALAVRQRRKSCCGAAPPAGR